MKTKILITIIFFIILTSASFEAYSIMLDNEKYVAPDYNSIFIGYNYSNCQNSFNMGYNINILKNLDLNYAIFGYEWLNNDKYNENKQNISRITWINSLVFLGYNFGFTLQDSSLTKRIIAGTLLSIAIIDNSMLKYDFFDFPTYNNNYFKNSIYYKNKLDYFGDLPNKFWRFYPGVGIAVNHVFRSNLDSVSFNSVELNFGLGYPIDFTRNGTYTGKLIPSFGIKFISRFSL